MYIFGQFIVIRVKKKTYLLFAVTQRVFDKAEPLVSYLQSHSSMRDAIQHKFRR